MTEPFIVGEPAFESVCMLSYHSPDLEDIHLTQFGSVDFEIPMEIATVDVAFEGRTWPVWVFSGGVVQAAEGHDRASIPEAIREYVRRELNETLASRVGDRMRDAAFRTALRIRCEYPDLDHPDYERAWDHWISIVRRDDYDADVRRFGEWLIAELVRTAHWDTLGLVDWRAASIERLEAALEEFGDEWADSNPTDN